MTDFLKNGKKWAEIRENPGYAPLREIIFKEYDEFCKDIEIPLIKFSDEMEYFKNGVRSNFEKLYFLKRRQMTIYAILSLIYPEREDYFVNLCDVVSAICDEYSWQVPAHRPAENRNKNDGHSLFAAETGMYLAEIKHIFSDRFDPCLTARITDAIEKKILTSFESRITGVEKKVIKNNWASVCSCGVGLAFMYEAPERFKKIRPRIEKCMENYLSGISEDGGTPEGANYWNYGFGFYELYYETIKRNFSKKEAEGLYREKAKKLSEFFSAVLLCKNSVVSFSDAGANAECSLWLAYFLKNEYGTPLPPKERLTFDSEEFSSSIRAFLYYNPSFDSEKIADGEKYFDKLEWYIKRGKNYSFAVKGGKNDIEDNHNHNDIGSFIVANSEKQVLCDLGSPQYNASNFGETRYMVLNNSSLGHSVPIVNGKEQGAGDGFYGKLTVADKIMVDLKNAYADKIGRLERSFCLEENGLTMTDEFDFGLDIKERLVTDIKPHLRDGCFIIEKTRISIPDGWQTAVSERETTYHNGKKHNVFLIDFTPTVDVASFTVKITFE